MKKTLLLMLFVINCLATDLVDIYRSQGIEAVKAELENELMKKEYWQSYLANRNIDYGYYESKKFVIVAQKDKKELELFKIDNNSFDLLLKDSVIIGENAGDKQEEGDLKTPIGAYDLTQKLTKLDDFYGPLALVTSYPNTFDKSLNKKGHGIWIHGMPLNQDRENYTKGCIALDNLRLEELDSSIDYDKSVLLISQKSLKKVTKDEMSLILSSIFKWRDAWKRSDFDSYISFYSDDFKRDNGMDLDGFKNYKKMIFSRDEDKRIKFTNINIIPYPNSLNKTMFKVVMDEDYRTRNYTFVGKKELYLELKDNEIKILAEG